MTWYLRNLQFVVEIQSTDLPFRYAPFGSQMVYNKTKQSIFDGSPTFRSSKIDFSNYESLDTESS